jgi:DNA polymerase III alpha subunit (gram-positive type)
MNRLIIDTETTGLSPTKNQVLTIGLLATDINHKRIKILDHNHIFIKHLRYDTSPRAMNINKIDLNLLNKTGVTPTQACKKVHNFLTSNNLNKTPIVGHNIAFDKNFLTNLFTQQNQNLPFHHETEDTLVLWRSLQRQSLIPSHLRGNLETVANHFQIDYTKAHDALADCHITAKVYHEMLKINHNNTS